jgi:hypothetical protein
VVLELPRSDAGDLIELAWYDDCSFRTIKPSKFTGASVTGSTARDVRLCCFGRLLHRHASAMKVCADVAVHESVYGP